MRTIAAIAFALMVSGAASTASEPALPCKGAPKIEGECFTIHGRLFVANGTPGVRIWRVGTTRILGVTDGDGDAEGKSLLPPSVQKLLKADPFFTDIYGDYNVCPLEIDRPGRMRTVCVESASHLLAVTRQGTIAKAHP